MLIDDKTKIPLFTVIVALPFIVGFIFWLSAVANDASQAKADVKGVKELVLDIRERVIRIEAQKH